MSVLVWLLRRTDTRVKTILEVKRRAAIFSLARKEEDGDDDLVSVWLEKIILYNDKYKPEHSSCHRPLLELQQTSFGEFYDKLLLMNCRRTLYVGVDRRHFNWRGSDWVGVFYIYTAAAHGITNLHLERKEQEKIN